MPWTAADASKYTKKAQSAAQRARWAAIANEHLDTCRQDGGDLDECEAAAIRIANAALAETAEGTMPELREQAMKTVGGERFPASDFLVVEDPEKPTTWHLQVKSHGTPDHRLMGAAWAALHQGYRGNVYEGPDQAAALRKLKALYASEDMETPAAEAAAAEMYDEPEPIAYSPAVSFAAMQAQQAAEESAGRIRELAHRFQMLVGNIFMSLPPAEQIPALRALIDEFAALFTAELGDLGSGELAPPPAAPLTELAEVELAEPGTGRVVELVEATNAPALDRRAPLVLDMVLIEPGWGNKSDNHYYPAETLARDAHVFEGVKMYATDHRDAEKSTRTEVATVQRVKGFARSGAPIVRVGIHDPNFAEATRNRAALGTLGTLECSIMAQGRARPGFEEGGRTGKYVEAITQGVAVDFVTRAGAGGRALALVESETGGGPVTTPQTEVEPVGSDDEQPAAVAAAEVATETQAVTIQEDAPAAPAAVEEIAAPDPAPVLLSEAEIDAALAESRLPALAQAKLRPGPYADAAALAAAIGAERAYIKELTGSGTPFAPASRPAAAPVTLAEVEQRQHAINKRWGFAAPRAA